MKKQNQKFGFAKGAYTQKLTFTVATDRRNFHILRNGEVILAYT